MRELAERPSWMSMSACRGLPAETFLPPRGDTYATNRLRELCRSCAVAEACLRYSMTLDPPADGIWAGLGTRNRRTLRAHGHTRLNHGDAALYDNGQVVIVRGPDPLPDVADARSAVIAAIRAEDQRRDVDVDPDETRAHDLGLTPADLDRLRKLIAVRDKTCWAVGDLLVTAYGPPPAPGVMDGSRARLNALADELGCSASWLIACRLTASAWAKGERRSCTWAVHRDLRTRPDRSALLARFVASCELEHVTPSAGRLAVWLDAEANDSMRDASDRSVGRPKLDPVEKCYRQALALPNDALARLVDRLTVALAAAA